MMKVSNFIWGLLFCLLLPVVGDAQLPATSIERPEIPEQFSIESLSQWGGPNRNFLFPETELHEKWDRSGPKIKWKRDLGGGYSGIAVVDGRVFTTIRKAEQELDMALDAESGETIWSHAIEVPEQDLDYGMGPFATPLVTEDQVIILGGSGILRSLDRESGELSWRLDLSKKYEPWESDSGYASSPLLVNNLIILQVGSKQAAIVAADQKTGTPVWARHNFQTDYASPLAINVGNETRVICHMEDDVISINPTNGNLDWKDVSKSTRTQHVIAPIEIGKNTFLASTTYGVKAYQLKLNAPKLIWESNRIRSQVGNLIYLPDQQMILGASGASTGSPIVALDAKTGKLLWKSRSMQCGFLWQIGDRLFCLTRSGKLVQGTANRQELTTLSSHQVFKETKVWSAPGISGGLLVLKDQAQIVAFELNK
jgi:outer membrane protein assembly factor BamB